MGKYVNKESFLFHYCIVIFAFFYFLFSTLIEKLSKRKAKEFISKETDFFNQFKEFGYGKEEIDFMHRSLLSASKQTYKVKHKDVNYAHLLYKNMWNKYRMDEVIGINETMNEKTNGFNYIDDLKDLIILFSAENLLLYDSLYSMTYGFLKENSYEFINLFESLGNKKNDLEKCFFSNINHLKVENLRFYIFYNTSIVNESYSKSEQINFEKQILLITNEDNIPLKYVILKNRNNVKLVFNEIYNIKKYFINVKNIFIYCDIKLFYSKIGNYIEENNIFTREGIKIEILDESYIGNHDKNLIYIFKKHFERKDFGNIIIWDNVKIEGFCFMSFISLFFASNLFLGFKKYTLEQYLDSIKKIHLIKYNLCNKNIYIRTSSSPLTNKVLKKLGIKPPKIVNTKEELNKTFDEFRPNDILYDLG